MNSRAFVLFGLLLAALLVVSSAADHGDKINAEETHVAIGDDMANKLMSGDFKPLTKPCCIMLGEFCYKRVCDAETIQQVNFVIANKLISGDSPTLTKPCCIMLGEFCYKRVCDAETIQQVGDVITKKLVSGDFKPFTKPCCVMFSDFCFKRVCDAETIDQIRAVAEYMKNLAARKLGNIKMVSNN